MAPLTDKVAIVTRLRSVVLDDYADQHKLIVNQDFISLYPPSRGQLTC